MRKSPDAFRTISEVAQELDLPQHVLRFWETRFSQIKPMKRGGGRRYYRPDDVELLRGIRHLLYGEGYTIKGVQRILKEQGIRHVIEAFPGYVSVEGEAGEQPEAVDTVDAPPAISVPVAQDTTPQPSIPQAAATAPVVPAVPVSAPSVVAPANTAAEAARMPEAMTAPSAPVNNSVSHARAPETVENPVSANPNSEADLSDAALPSANQQVMPVSPAQAAVQNTGQAVEQPAPSGQTLGGAHPVQPHPQQPAVAMPVQPPQQTMPTPVAPHPTHAAPNMPLPNPAGLLAPNNPSSAIPPYAEPQPTPLPADLSQGEPAFMQGQDAAYSVETGRNSLAQENKAGFFSRLRGKNPTEDMSAGGGKPQGEAGMARDDVRRLQSTLFELLECKRILDQARNSS